MVRPEASSSGWHRVPHHSRTTVAEFRRLNAHASRGGGDRAAIAKVSKKQQNRSSSLASAYARRYAEQCPDAISALESLSFDESDEVSIGMRVGESLSFDESDEVSIGMRVGVPASHPNKYGYATSAIVVSVSRRQCVQLIEHARG